jgi:RNA polymerase sigma-70 factor, ECF subfamily
VSSFQERSTDFTALLNRVCQGEDGAAALAPLVYDELRAIAGSFLTQRRPGQTVQPTALVHEAYIKLVRDPQRRWEGRRHFFEVAAKAMRQILADQAKAAGRHKRGGGWRRLEVDVAAPMTDEPEIDFAQLDEALAQLSQLNDRHARVVELRFYAGLSVEEAAGVLGVSPRTVEQDWRVARAFLRRALREEQNEC